MGYFVYKLEGNIQHADEFLCLFGLFFSNDIPWQYIAIRIVILLLCIAIYRNTLLPYRDTPILDCNISIRTPLNILSKRFILVHLFVVLHIFYHILSLCILITESLQVIPAIGVSVTTVNRLGQVYTEFFPRQLVRDVVIVEAVKMVQQICVEAFY
jgi:hypothetical protein